MFEKERKQVDEGSVGQIIITALTRCRSVHSLSKQQVNPSEDVITKKIDTPQRPFRGFERFRHDLGVLEELGSGKRARHSHMSDIDFPHLPDFRQIHHFPIRY